MKDRSSSCCSCSCLSGSARKKKISPSISAPLHLILKAPSPASHEWKRIAGARRVCQICHFALDDQRGVLRCQSCGLRAHSQCGSLKLTAKPPPSSSSTVSVPPPRAAALFHSTSDNNLLTTAEAAAAGKGPHFEPRIKKLLQVSIPLPPTGSGVGGIGAAAAAQSVHSDHSGQSQLSSCGDYSIAASTAIAVGTTTIASTETPRSESKSPEITITPGSEAGDADQFDGDRDRDRRHQEERDRDRDRLTVPQHRQHQIHRFDQKEHQQGIRYVEGPLDSALYAVVNPAAKVVDAPSSADSGISVSHVDQMKDLDRLLNALVQDAESIPDIPYHAREDSLPFSYGMPDTATLKQRQELQERLASRRQREEEHEQRRERAPAPSSAHAHAPYSYTAQRSMSPTTSPYSAPPPATAPTRRVQQRPTPTAGLPSHYSNAPVKDSTEYIDKLRQVQQQQQQSQAHVPSQYQPRYTSAQLLQRARGSEPIYAPRYPHAQPRQQQQQQPRTHHLQLELEDQIIPYHRERERVTRYESPPRGASVSRGGQQHDYSRSLSSSYADRDRSQPIYYPSVQSEPGSRERVYRFYTSTPQEPQQQQRELPAYRDPPPSSFSFNNFGRAIEGVGTGMERMRSISAEGRRPTESWRLTARELEARENADEWLRRQKQRLHEKRAATRPQPPSEWLRELQAGLGRDERDESDAGVKPSSYSSITRFTPSGYPQTRESRVPRSATSTPVQQHTGAGLYSSDDESSEFERDYGYGVGRAAAGVGRGRGIQRYHSESAYDARARAASQSSYGGSTSGVESGTPGFPTCPPTPYLNRPASPSPAYKPPRSPKSARKGVVSGASEWTPVTPTTTSAAAVSSSSAASDYGLRESRAQTPVNPRPVFMVDSEVKFARDMSSYWYKPNANREETISALRYAPAGSFVIRNSNSFPGAFGLAIKVNEGTTTEDSVRHFLIEPTKYGVRLRGSAVEPVFGSLSALVYAHSIDPLALPTTLTLPAGDTVLPISQAQSTTAHLLTQGAACQLLFIGVVGVELVTGDDAVKRGIGAVVGTATPAVVSLRLSKHGLTLTDILRQRFFRLHFPLEGISYAAVDPAGKSITHRNASRKIFAIIARAPTAQENSCVVLAELEEGQPAQAIVAFIQRVIAWQS